MDVTDASPFRKDDRVLVHQAKGMSLSNSANDSGVPQSQASCGYFDFATVDRVVGNRVYLTTHLAHGFDYNMTGLVQMVPVVYSSRVRINGPLTASAWNGQCGGIIAIEATDTIVLNSSIDVSAIGFKGGDVSQPYHNCGTSPAMDAQFPSAMYGQKGEGCATLDVSRQAGRGRIASGGGGGANHNAGGAGGGNGGAGGDGGAVYGVCGVEVNGGLGGVTCSVDVASPRLFYEVQVEVDIKTSISEVKVDLVVEL